MLPNSPYSNKSWHSRHIKEETNAHPLTYIVWPEPQNSNLSNTGIPILKYPRKSVCTWGKHAKGKEYPKTYFVLFKTEHKILPKCLKNMFIFKTAQQSDYWAQTAHKRIHERFWGFPSILPMFIRTRIQLHLVSNILAAKRRSILSKYCKDIIDSSILRVGQFNNGMTGVFFFPMLQHGWLVRLFSQWICTSLKGRFTYKHKSHHLCCIAAQKWERSMNTRWQGKHWRGLTFTRTRWWRERTFLWLSSKFSSSSSY